MATVFGTLSDFGFAALADSYAEVSFIPSSAAVFGGRLLVGRQPVTVKPDARGYFEVDLVPTEEITRDTWYRVKVSWLDPIGGMPHEDYLDLKLYVPELGGTISHLLRGVSSKMPLVVWQPTEPDPWPDGLIWVNTITGRLKKQV